MYICKFYFDFISYPLSKYIFSGKMTLPNGIRIGLDGMSMEDLSSLLVNMGRHA